MPDEMALSKGQRNSLAKKFKCLQPSQEFPQERNLKDTHIFHKGNVSSNGGGYDGGGGPLI